MTALGDLPILSDVVPMPFSTAPPENSMRINGRELIEKGLSLKLAQSCGVVWIAYQRINVSR
jgi:hypothetical protein